jgi:hypothetical protein
VRSSPAQSPARFFLHTERNQGAGSRDKFVDKEGDTALGSAVRSTERQDRNAVVFGKRRIRRVTGQFINFLCKPWKTIDFPELT